MKARIAKILPVLALGLCAGCASSAPPLPPSLELPATVNDLHAVRKGSHVELSWTVPMQTTDHEGIRRYGATRICRNADAALKTCGTAVGTVPPLASPEHRKPAKKPAEAKVEAREAKTTARYTDELPAAPNAQPEDQVTYAVEALNPDGRSAGLSNRVQVPVFPVPAPPADFASKMTAEGVHFTWTCPASQAQFPNVQYNLRIERRLKNADGYTTVGDGNFSNCSNGQLTGSSFEWEKTYDYRAFVVALIDSPGKPQTEIDGDNTPSITVDAHDVFPPAVPSGLQAVFSGAGQALFIDLVWTPDGDADLAGYNIYRHEENGDAVKLNAELVKGPAYRDSTVQLGKKYFYSVSAVDVRGNESVKSEEGNEKVP